MMKRHMPQPSFGAWETGQPSGSTIDPLSVKNQCMIIRHMVKPSWVRGDGGSGGFADKDQL